MIFLYRIWFLVSPFHLTLCIYYYSIRLRNGCLWVTAFHELKELDLEEIDNVAGGGFCWTDYMCATIDVSRMEDEHGHDRFCYTIYHCLTAFMHTDTEMENSACWSDYKCLAINI